MTRLGAVCRDSETPAIISRPVVTRTPNRLHQLTRPRVAQWGGARVARPDGPPFCRRSAGTGFWGRPVLAESLAVPRSRP